MEFVEVEAQVVEKLKQGNDALKALQKELSVEDVEEVMSDAAELRQWVEVRSTITSACFHEALSASLHSHVHRQRKCVCVCVCMCVCVCVCGGCATQIRVLHFFLVWFCVVFVGCWGCLWAACGQL